MSSKFTYLEKSPDSPTQDRFPVLFLPYERLNLKTILTVMMALRHRHTLLLLLPLFKAVRPVLPRAYMGNKVGGLLERPRRKWREERKTRFKLNPFQCVHFLAGVAHCFEKASASCYYLLAFIHFYSYYRKNVSEDAIYFHNARWQHLHILESDRVTAPGRQVSGFSLHSAFVGFFFIFWNGGHEFNL